MLTPSEIEKMWDTARFVGGGESPHKVFAAEVEAAATAPLLVRIAALTAQVEQADHMCRVAKSKLADLIAKGYRECGVMIERTDEEGTVQRGAVSNGGMVIWWHTPQIHEPKKVEQAAQPVAGFEALETAIQEYIDDYEMLGETEDGRDAYYTPNENEKALLLDAFMGFDFSQWRTPSPPMKAADEFELRRLLAEERETTRQLNRALRNATEGPVFMGEPALSAESILKPMTPAQRRMLIDAAGDKTDGLNQDDFADEIVLAVERHYGITTHKKQKA